MQAQVFPTSEAQSSVALLLLLILGGLRKLYSILHQPLQLRQRLLDLGDGSRTVDELPLRGVELNGSVRPSPAALADADILVGRTQSETGARRSCLCPKASRARSVPRERHVHHADGRMLGYSTVASSVRLRSHMYANCSTVQCQNHGLCTGCEEGHLGIFDHKEILSADKA